MKDTDTCSIDEQEWQDILSEIECLKSFPDGKTRMELAELWGVGGTTAKHRLKVLEGKGLIERGIKYITDMSGRSQPTPAYRILKK